MVTAVARANRKKSGAIRVGHGFAAESKFRAKLRGNTGDIGTLADECRRIEPTHPDSGRERRFLPSESWVDSHFNEIEDIDADGNLIVIRYYRRSAKESPLNGAAPAMVRCPSCAHLTPPNALEGGRCADCQSRALHEAYGGSPSARAISELQMRNLRLEQVKLKPEDKSSLRREIKRVKQGKWIPRG